MGQQRIFTCDTCGEVYTEKNMGEGAPGWSGMIGVKLNGRDNPVFCNKCTTKIMTYIDKEVAQV